jgi:hypothetical protein
MACVFPSSCQTVMRPAFVPAASHLPDLLTAILTILASLTTDRWPGHTSQPINAAPTRAADMTPAVLRSLPNVAG